MIHDHLVNHIHNKALVSDNTLYVIGVVSNPVRYHSRYRIFRQWQKVMENTPNVELYIVEAAYGDRAFEIADPKNPKNLCLRTNQEIWIKEPMINLGVRILPRNWKYLAWIDGDVFFRDPNWAQETLHQLQHFPIIQPWSDALDLGPKDNVLQLFKSFGAQHQRRIPKQKHPSQPYCYAHTGFGWACTRAFWEQVGGLPDYCILGSADHHAAFACIGEVVDTIHAGMAPSFFRRLYEWQRNALKITHNEVGFVSGRIEHEWHGKKRDRRYRERWELLINGKFDPDRDLTYDSQGLIHLNNPKLEQEIRLYNRARNEDSIDEY